MRLSWATRMGNNKSGADWSDEEIELIVADYFEMYKLDLAGQKFNKAARKRALQAQIGRSESSIDFKWRNISAVIHELGHPYVRGLAPAMNYQAALVEAVAQQLGAIRIEAPTPEIDLALEVGAPRPASGTPAVSKAALTRLIRKFDPAARDAHNRTLGRLGEQLVFNYERQRLKDARRDDLASKVQWVSQEIGDGAGFDILSFDNEGQERLLEVKATNGGSTTPFYISANEWAVSEERTEAFHLVRVYDIARTPKAFELRAPLDKWLLLDPINYRANLRF